MGTGASKDKFVDLYISTNKQYYFPGEWVEGQAYMNVLNTVNYSNLCLRLEGVQHVYWQTGSGKRRRTYSNTYKSYTEHNLLVDFHGTVNCGHYLFQFTFLLPNMMTGSFLLSQSNYIKYLLKLQLVHQTDQNKTQRFITNLNILQPPRMPFGALSITKNVHAQCCGCCIDYGTTSVTLNCNTNFAYNGDPIQISGLINNTNGKQNIENWSINLEERRIMISSGGAVRRNVDRKFPLLVNPGLVPAGGSKDFNFNAVVPQSIVNYTAIGRVTARYFVIVLTSQYGCCTKQNAGATLHIIIHSKTPMIVQKKQIPPPPGWSPKIFPKIVWNNLKPYNYSPLPQIPFLNMPTAQNVQPAMMINETTENFESYDNGGQGFGYQMNGYVMPTNQFVPSKFQINYNNYNPVFYDQNMLSDAEKMYQGYGGAQMQGGMQQNGVQPNFNNGNMM